MPLLRDGESVHVAGSTASYTLERKADVFSCSCPAWRNQRTPIANRSCKHLRAYLGEAAERDRVGSVAPASRRLPRPAWVPDGRDDADTRTRRQAALASALEIFPVAFDKMMMVHGLRMPEHLAYAMGFWLGLSEPERRVAWALFGTGPCGVGELFEEGGLDRAVLPGLDERLASRFRRDPPEMVSVFGGNSDGSHWGLWYDDPAELPRAIAHNWARDTAETTQRKSTLLGTLRAELYDTEDPDPLGERFPHAGAMLAWLDEVHALELEAHRDEAIPPLAHRARTVGGLGPWIPGWSLPSDIGTDRMRLHQYQQRAPVVDEWIARARAELADGRPGLALVIGRDLHWLDSDPHRVACTELLIGGYRALGRDALAEIVRVHHANRDLPSVNIYADRDDPAMREVIVPYADAHTVTQAQLHHLAALRRGEEVERHQQAFATLLTRGVELAVLEAAVRSGNPALLAQVVSHVDLAWRDEANRSALHLMCRWACIDGARRLLNRGADGTLTDRDGETPYAAIKHAWTAHRREADELYALLRTHGFGPAAAASPIAADDAWTEGSRVSHARFGDGVIKAVAGRGADAKLTIQFAGDTKTLLAKFVVRA